MPDPVPSPVVLSLEEKVAAVMGRAVTAEELDALRQQHDDDPLRFASEVDDIGWWIVTGMCGGCGCTDCHEGPCGHDGNGLCDRCPDRGGSR